LTGEFLIDLFVKGTYTDAQSAAYTGTFDADGGLQGEGKLSNGEGVFTGVFTKGLLQGEGKCVLKNGAVCM
jgi:hypothetical protein